MKRSIINGKNAFATIYANFKNNKNFDIAIIKTVDLYFNHFIKI